MHRARRTANSLIAAGLLVVSGSLFAQTEIAGEWTVLLHEDRSQRRDPPGPSIGDYTGLPINAAARMRADTWDASRVTLKEHQTQPATTAYGFHGPSDMRISKVISDASQTVIAYKIYLAPFAGVTRMIWLDGRLHPPEYAAHTFSGFSSGTWSGGMLTVETTHLKNGWLLRNGVPHSERATVTEHFIRHGNYLTIVGIVYDPVYLDGPLIRTWNFALDPDQQLPPVPTQAVDEIAGRIDGYVPHHLPGTNPALQEFAEQIKIPFEATRGGVETTRPEYQERLRQLMKKPHNATEAGNLQRDRKE